MEPTQKSNGALIGSIIIILILIIGGIYLYTTKVSKAPEAPQIESVDTEASVINADLDTFDTENIDNSAEFNTSGDL